MRANLKLRLKFLNAIMFLVLIAVISSFGEKAEAQELCFTGVEDEYGRMVPMSNFEEWQEHQFKLYYANSGLTCEKLQSYKDLADGVIESIEVVETAVKGKKGKSGTIIRLIITTVKTGTRVAKVWLAGLPCDVKEIEKAVTSTVCNSSELANSNITCRNINSSDDVLNLDWLNGTSPQNMCTPEGSYNL